MNKALAQDTPLNMLNQLLRRGDIGLALGLVCIIIVLILPIPTWLLDTLLALSITFSVLILMTVLFIEKALEFSSFPTVLLISTLLRLSLNLASTRLILARGHEGPQAAGHVIQAFGNFVMGGNFVIGVIVFAILTLVNFVVITKGSGRIAEVGARFSLDAMPGKQMAIDADLSAGMIDEAGAKVRRKELEEESNFYGSMDGAAKFVRGDAIAGLIITVVNLVGGVIIGTVQNNLDLSQAIYTYSTLTIGDGLVTQIPALIVSTAAGMLVSKAGTVGSTDKALFAQLTNYPSALGLSSVLMSGMSLLPGMPMIPFLLLAGISGYAAWKMTKRGQTARNAETAKETAAQAKKDKAEEPISAALSIDLVRLELGYGLLPFINESEGQNLSQQIKSLRRQLAQEIGFIMPSIRIQDNLQLGPNNYVIRVKEIEAGAGELHPGMLLVMDPKGAPITMQGIATKEPTFGLPATWIDQNSREEALFKNYTVVDPVTVISTHMVEIIKDNMSELLSYSETQKLLNEIGKEHEKLVQDVIPNQISVSGLQRILQNLLAERVSIRDLPTILEGISEASLYSKNLNILTEHVRTRLARQISDGYTSHNGYIPLLTLSPEWERVFAESLIGDGEEKQLSLPPSKLQDFMSAVRQAYEKQALSGELPIVLTSPNIRYYVRSLIERFRPNTPIMSQNEIHPKAKIKTVGQI